MERKLFVEKLQNYYDNSNKHTQRLIEWCCVNNNRCTEKIFQFILNRTIKENRKSLIMNWDGEMIDEEIILKDITNDDIDYLRTEIRELDGTLLVDIVWKFMQKYKIFK